MNLVDDTKAKVEEDKKIEIAKIEEISQKKIELAQAQQELEDKMKEMPGTPPPGSTPP